MIIRILFIILAFTGSAHAQLSVGGTGGVDFGSGMQVGGVGGVTLDGRSRDEPASKTVLATDESRWDANPSRDTKAVGSRYTLRLNDSLVAESIGGMNFLRQSDNGWKQYFIRVLVCSTEKCLTATDISLADNKGAAFTSSFHIQARTLAEAASQLSGADLVVKIEFHRWDQSGFRLFPTKKVIAITAVRLENISKHRSLRVLSFETHQQVGTIRFH